MANTDYHYYVHITVINTDNLIGKKYSEYAHKQKREREGGREGGGEKERVHHTYWLVIEVEIKHSLAELQDVAVLVVLMVEP